MFQLGYICINLYTISYIIDLFVVFCCRYVLYDFRYLSVLNNFYLSLSPVVAIIDLIVVGRACKNRNNREV